jgi:hypothetical protein
MRTPFGGDFDLAVAFTAIMTGNIRDLDADAELNGLPPDQGPPRQPISARSLGRSITLPQETTRRHVETLLAGGWIERRDQGLVVAPGLLSSPRMAPVAAQLGERLAVMVGRLAAMEEPAPGFRLAPDRGAMLIAVSGKYMLRWVERHISAPGDVVTAERLSIGALLFWAVLQANIRHFIDDPELQRRYADSLPPDALRRPASIRSIAESLGMPYETVRSGVQPMIGFGLLTRVRGGLIVSRDRLAEPQTAAARTLNIANLRQLLTQLSGLGVLLPT